MSARPSILYIDDEEHNLTVFEAAFEDYYNVHTTSSAREAIRILKEEVVCLIIADQRMPEMTGVQLLEVVVNESPDTVRMILTGYSDVDAVIKAINAGRIYQYVTKPWDERELKVVIDRALESYEAERRNRDLLEELKQRAARETEIRQAFQRYVPAPVIDQILDVPTRELYIGESRVVAVLFSDIRGFTTLSASLEPARVVAFLNRYFSLMTRIVSRHQGTVDRFLGDGIVAVFGAPVSSLNNAEDAVSAALDMVEALDGFNRKDALELVGEEIRIGIGIDQGEVVVGHVGSEEKMEYTVVGDVVEGAMRIEELTKSVPNSILSSRSVYERTLDLIEVECLEPVATGVGAEPQPLYRVLRRSPGGG